ncbi:MAG: hypothetical protein BIFFINMI_02635 [Phycisphaerae bacterium]|nr:hypothetical protein [Phycisphaerae bacterium]
MRDDFKIGILLGFLLILAFFIYWIVRMNSNSGIKSAENTTKQVADAGGSGGGDNAGTSNSSNAGQTNTGSSNSAGGGTASGDAHSARDERIPDVASARIPVNNERAYWVHKSETGPAPTRQVEPVAPPAPPRPSELGMQPEIVAGGGAPPRPPVVTGGEERLGTGTGTGMGTATPGPTVADSTHPDLRVAPDGTRTYQIKKDDTAWLLAERFYTGRGPLWTLLRDANPEIKDWNNLKIGATIKVPPAPVAGASTAGSTTTTGGTTSGGRTLAANEYVVQRGETLSEIAQKKYGRFSAWKDIAKANPDINPETGAIHEGQVIKLPELAAAPVGGTTTGGTATGGATTGGTTSPALAPGQYRVKGSDTLWDIAASQLGNGARWKEIYELNKQTIGNSPDDLKEGMILSIPGRSTPPTRAPATRTPAPGATGGTETPISTPPTAPSGSVL